jgi:hypothetical protein
MNEFIGHLQLVTTNNYNTTAISTLYSSLEHTVECSQSDTRRFLATAPTMAILLPLAPVLSSQTPAQNSLSTDLVRSLYRLGTDHVENTDLLLLHR